MLPRLPPLIDALQPLLFAMVWSGLIMSTGVQRPPAWEDFDAMFRRNEAFLIRHAEDDLRAMDGLRREFTYEPERADYYCTIRRQAQAYWLGALRLSDALKLAAHRLQVNSLPADSLCRNLDAFLDSTRVFVETGAPPYEHSVWYFLKPNLALQYGQEGQRNDSAYQGWSRNLLGSLGVEGRTTTLSALANAVLASAAAAVRYRYERSIPLRGCGFNGIRAHGILSRAYTFRGQQLTAEIVLLAWETHRNPRMTSSSGSVAVDGGVGNWRGVARNVGQHTIRGTASQYMDTVLITKPWSFEYRVIPRTATLTLDKATTLFSHIPNPISISAEGYALSALRIHIPGVRVSRESAGHFIAYPTPSGPAACTAYILAPLPDRSGTDTLCIQPLRACALSPPVLRIAGFGEDGAAIGAALRTASGPALHCADEEHDGLWRLLQCRVSLLRIGEEDRTVTLQGAEAWQGAGIQGLLRAARPGDRLLIDEAIAEGPGAVRVALAPYAVRLTD